MGKRNRRLIGSATIGAATAVTLAQFLPGVAAAAAAHHSSLSRSNGDGSANGRMPGASKPVPDVAATLAPTGCSASSSPDFGCGKLTLQAQPVGGTFPKGSSPDLGNLELDITGPAASMNTVTDGSTGDCVTVADNTDSDATCPESLVALLSNDEATWVAGGEYHVTLDSSTPAPADTLIPGIFGVFPNCSAYQDDGTTPTGCPDLTPVPVYGTYHRTGLTVINSATHKPVAKARYELCTATAGPPSTGTSGCPSGSTEIVAATSNSKGHVAFPSLYLGSDNYSVAPLREPRGYRKAVSKRLKVPMVTTATEAGTLVQIKVTLVPIPPVVKKDHVTTTQSTPVTFNALAGAKAIVGPLKVRKVGKPAHGSVRLKQGKLTYTPKNGYVGNDTFTYTARNAVGGTATGRVVVRVKA